MAVLGRLKIAPNQRLDLPDIQAFDSFSAGDWTNFLQGLTGGNPYVLQGFDIFQPNTLIGNPASVVNINLASAAVWWPQGGQGSFFVSLPTATTDSVTLITNATNFIEMTFTLGSGAQDARALWDPGANGGAGGEFTQVVDTETFLEVTISRNNTGFDSDAIPLAEVVVNSSNNVVAITDCRPLLFRLGSGGTTPDPTNNFAWPNVPNGFSRTDTVTTMTSPSDPNPFQGADKNIQSLKSWMDAVMTRIKEIDGGPRWFTPSGAASGSGGSLSLAQLYLDSAGGHSPVPTRNVRFAWSQANDGNFRSLNAVGVNQAAAWKATFGQLTWSLGGSFIASNNRAYSSFLFSQNVPAGQNLYLHLQRDVALNSDPSVTWQNINGVTASATASGTGAFTGIAVGDFIRKKSGTTFQYYQIVEIRVSSGTPFTNGTVFGTVADGTVQYVIVSTHDGPIVTSSEQYRYFRTQYATTDLVASQYGQYDSSYYWIGVNVAGMFFLRYYGDMQPGEEAEILDPDDSAPSFGGGGSASLLLEQAENAVYDPTNGYSLKTGSGTLLTIVRRLSDNTVGTPSNSDNSGASPSYTITAPVGTMNDGDGLWVRLSNSAGGTLAAGTVTNVATDNVYQTLPQTQNPLNIYNNLNVFLLARKYTINGVATLIFTDGTWLSLDGTWINNSFSVQQDLFLKNKTQWSIPYISTTTGKVDQNNAQFFWNNTAGQDSLGQFGVRNIRISEDSVAGIDYFTQAVPQDVVFFGNLGAHTITVGQNNSTTIFPGNIVVQGTSSAVSTASLLVTDKQIVVGVGNLNNGGGDSGLAVADNTVAASSYSSTSGQDFVNINYGFAHGYVVGNVVWVDTNQAVGGITAGQMNGPYTVVSSGTAVGTALVTSTTSLRIFTTGSASSTQTETVGGAIQFFTFLTPSNILMSDSSGNTSGMTSWTFQVKGIATTPTITPRVSYPIVPTAASTNANTGNVPFLGNDGAGPSASNTTYNYSNNFNWNNSTNTLTVGGSMSIAGDLDPSGDNLYELGDFNLRWQDINLGPLGAIVHNDATNTTKVTLGFTGATATLLTDSTTPLQVSTGANSGINIDTAGRIGILSATSATSSLIVSQTAVNATGVTQYGLYLSPALSGTTETNFLYVLGQTLTNTTPNAASIRVANMTVSSGGSVTTQYGVRIDDLTTGTVNNHGVFSAIAAATGKWFLYGSGTATNYLAGGLGIGNSTQASINAQRLLLGVNTDTTAAGGMNFGTDTTLYRFASGNLKTDGILTVVGNVVPGTDNVPSIGTTALRWNTLHSGPNGFVAHNDATNTAKVTLGFTAAVATLTSDSTTSLAIGVSSAIAIQIDTSNRIGIGSAATTVSHMAFNSANPATGTSTNSLSITETQPTSATTLMAGVTAQMIVPSVGSLTTFSAAYAFQVLNGSVGTNATLSNQYGLFVSNLTAGTANYGIYGNISAGANKWFVYDNGGATSAFLGNVGIGNQTQATINNQRLLIGVNTDTTAAGGISFGGDTTQYRQAANILAFSASLLPSVDATYDLGSATQRWRNIFASGSIAATGSIRLNYGTTQTTNYSATTSDNLIPVNTSTGQVTVTLPTSVAGNKGQWIIVKDVGGFVANSGKAIVVAPNGTDTIDGANASVTIDFNPYSALEFVSNGLGGWSIL